MMKYEYMMKYRLEKKVSVKKNNQHGTDWQNKPVKLLVLMILLRINWPVHQKIFISRKSVGQNTMWVIWPPDPTVPAPLIININLTQYL